MTSRSGRFGLSNILGLGATDPDLLVARAEALTRQIPLMYAVVLICTWTLVVTYFPFAPLSMTVLAPAILTLASAARLVLWWRNRNATITADKAKAMMHQTVLVAFLLGVAFVLWAYGLNGYGGAFEQAHLAFFLGLTPISCLFCLMHLRTAALAITVTVLLPTLVFFYFTGNRVLFTISINLLLVELSLVAILVRNSIHFDDLVASRRDAQLQRAEAEALSQSNAILANIDPLIGLPNRRSFLALLDDKLAAATAPGKLVVGIIDLDGFKAINDVFGHAMGDHVLVEVGQRLTRFAGRSAVLSRMGGDEFGLLFEGRDFLHLASAITESLKDPFHCPGAVARLSGSIGYSTARPGDTADAILARADYAAYEAKATARGTAVEFSDMHEARIAWTRKLEAALQGANLESEIVAHFQPIVDAITGDRIGYEALARWQNPVLGNVPPNDFIPLAERLGLISTITRCMVAQSLALVAQLPTPLRISVNLSGRDLASREAMRSLSQMLSSGPSRPCRLDFEITETAVMRDIGESSDALLTLLAHGARISLDDFGTGHSSLSRVRTLPLDRIKVDRSFINNIESDSVSEAILKTTIDLCNNLGIVCVVEGVETPVQVAALTRLGARFFQGYYFGRPVQAAEVLAATSARPSGAQDQLTGTARL